MFAPGEVISRREVLHGELWLSAPVTVVADVGEVLATAASVVDLLDRDERWWSDWDDWTP